MSKLKHTPWPWIAQKMMKGVRITSPHSPVKYSNGDIPIIASVPFHRSSLGLKYYDDDIEAISNARLIENAPEMLEALIAAHIALEYVSEYDIPLCTKERVVKAIENAAGMKIEEVLNCENKK